MRADSSSIAIKYAWRYENVILSENIMCVELKRFEKIITILQVMVVGGSLCMTSIESKINVNLENEDDNQRMSQLTTQDNHFAPDCIEPKSIKAFGKRRKNEKETKLSKCLFDLLFHLPFSFWLFRCRPYSMRKSTIAVDH